MPWLWLLVAGALEVAWAVGLKYTDGFRNFWPSAVTVVLMIGSFLALAQAVRGIPLGTAYAVWTGIGAVGTAIFGILLFAENVSFARLACLGLVIVGIVGLKLTSSVPLVPLPPAVDARVPSDPPSIDGHGS
jgi:quaternary ammonium compound-resistance protein SugE